MCLYALCMCPQSNSACGMAVHLLLSASDLYVWLFGMAKRCDKEQHVQVSRAAACWHGVGCVQSLIDSASPHHLCQAL